MATTIELKNSVTTGNSPSTLAQGEMGVNVTDKKIWVGNASSTPIQLIGAGASMSLTSLTTSSDASISGLTVGKGGGSGSDNTAVGANAMATNSTGVHNTAFGYNALTTNSTGQYNTAIGQAALQNATVGNNTAVGQASAYLTTTGQYITAIGTQAMVNNTTGSNNTAVGYNALVSNTTASNNTAVGYQALYSYTTNGGNADNTALGYRAGYSTTTSVQNTFIGSASGASNTTGAYNTAVGFYAGYTATTAQQNTFIGYYTGQSTTGGYNTFVGTAAGYLVTSGSKNTIIGAYTGNQGGLNITTSSNYIVLSDGDGNPRLNINGSGQTKINTVSTVTDGTEMLSVYTNTSNGVCAGFQNTTAGTGTVGISNAGTGSSYLMTLITGGTYRSSIYWNGAIIIYGTGSDLRLKENIVDAPSALSKIESIKVRSFDWKESGTHTDFGVIAQELETVAPECVIPGIDNPDGTMKQSYSVDTSVLIPSMIKAIQELNAKVTALEAKLGA